MGAGKSTKLKEIEESNRFFGYSFCDLDEMIFKNEGSGFNQLGELIEKRGFEWFRSAELETLKNIWDGSSSWSALGGGALSESVLEIIHSREDIRGYFIDTDFDTCYKRIKDDTNRPLSKKSKFELKKLYEDRLSLYSQFKPLVIP